MMYHIFIYDIKCMIYDIMIHTNDINDIMIHTNDVLYIYDI